MTDLFANSGDPDQTTHSAASDLDLHCFPITLLGASRLQWVKQFVCVEVLRPSQPNGVMSSAVSLPNHTFTGQAVKRLTSIVHILSPETDNYPS